MDLHSIPCDMPIAMTVVLRAAFLADGCDPMCHCCQRSIDIGLPFKLTELEGIDEMLCDSCTVTELAAAKRIRRPGEKYNKHLHVGPDPMHGGVPGDGGAGWSRKHSEVRVEDGGSGEG